MANAISNLFGRPKQQPLMVNPPKVQEISQSADATAESVRRRLLRTQRATMVSNLSQPNVMRKTLGAG